MLVNKNQTYYLVAFTRDYRDEFTYEQTFLCKGDMLDKVKAKVEEWKDIEADYFFGTNDGFECETVGELWTSVQSREIDEKTYNTLQEILPTGGDFFYWIIELEEDDE